MAYQNIHFTPPNSPKTLQISKFSFESHSSPAYNPREALKTPKAQNL